MKAPVLCNGSETSAFSVNVGMKQGCIVVPTLFSFFMGVVPQLTEKNMPNRVGICYRFNSNLFNLGSLQARSKISHTSIVKLQYSKDTAVCSCSEEGLQNLTDALSTTYSWLVLILNTKKTEVLYQPTSAATANAQPCVNVNGEPLQTNNCFKYHGSHISSNATVDDEISHRISSAAAAFSRLKNRVFQIHNIRQRTKLLVYNVIMLPPLLIWMPNLVDLQASSQHA